MEAGIRSYNIDKALACPAEERLHMYRSKQLSKKFFTRLRIYFYLLQCKIERNGNETSRNGRGFSHFSDPFLFVYIFSDNGSIGRICPTKTPTPFAAFFAPLIDNCTFRLYRRRLRHKQTQEQEDAGSPVPRILLFLFHAGSTYQDVND